MEKKLYSPGYHVEWSRFQNDPTANQLVHQSKQNKTLFTSTNCETPILSFEKKQIDFFQEDIKKDTVVPATNSSQEEEEYFTPKKTTDFSSNSSGNESLKITKDGEEKLSKLSEYLIVSALATMVPMLFAFYIPLFIVNLFIIRKIKALATLSPNESYYHKQIKRYWKIILWPLYALALIIMMFLFLTVLYILFI